MRKLATGTVILVVGLAAPGVRANDWGMAGLDLARTRLSTERSGASFGDATWTLSIPVMAAASPVVADGFLVTVDLAGVVTAVRADSGEQVWQVVLGSQVHGTPAIARGRVFVPTLSNVLFALSLTDGAMLWSRDTGGMLFSSPTPVDDDIVIAPGLPHRNVVRLSGKTGEIVWQTPDVMWEFSNSPPAVGSGLVVVVCQGGHIYGFDSATGAERWEYVGDGTVNLTAPLIFGGRVYMAGGDLSNRVHAVDLATGRAAAGWPITLPTPAPDISGTLQGTSRAISSFAAAGGLLLLETRLDDALGPRASGPFNWLSREFLVALDPSSGALVWQQVLARAENADINNVPKFILCPAPAAYGTDAGPPLIAVASTLDSMLAVFDVATGTERARYAVAGPALASPVLANGRLYTTTMNGTTQAFQSTVNHAPAAPAVAQYADSIDLATGSLSWSAAVDADGESAGYEVRIDADGELLEDWQEQLFVNAGMISAGVPASLVPGVTYTFAVRARDPHGALSPWSSPGTFTVTGKPGPAGGAPSGGMPPGGMPTAGMPTGMTGGTPTISITVPGSMTIEQPGQASGAGGCSVTGRVAGDWEAALAILAILAIVAMRTRRRGTHGRVTR